MATTANRPHVIAGNARVSVRPEDMTMVGCTWPSLCWMRASSAETLQSTCPRGRFNLRPRSAEDQLQWQDAFCSQPHTRLTEKEFEYNKKWKGKNIWDKEMTFPPASDYTSEGVGEGGRRKGCRDWKKCSRQNHVFNYSQNTAGGKLRSRETYGDNIKEQKINCASGEIDAVCLC